MTTFRGSLVALVTPFRNGELDLSAYQSLIDYQLQEGTDGLVVCGTTAESPTLTSDEQVILTKTALEMTKNRCPVIAGTGSNSTAGTLKASRLAAELGVDGIMVVTPYYNKPTQRGLYEHFSSVAAGVDLPIIVYNIPGRCAREIEHETLCRLFKDHANITTVKHATGLVEGAARLQSECDIQILSGDDPLTLPMMAVGAQGVISVVANLLPAHVKALTDAWLAGKYDQATKAHQDLYPIATALLSLETNPIPIKTALAMKGMIQEEFRLPMCTMSENNRTTLQHLLAAKGIL